MIRINLLPQKRRTERGAEGSQVWLFVILGIFLVEIAGFVIFHLTKVEELEGQLRTNKEIQSQIDQAKATGEMLTIPPRHPPSIRRMMLARFIASSF